MTPMNIPDFVRQTDQPLYPKALFSRPITRSGGGHLLIIGGHAGEFSLPTSIHQFAMAAGVGEATAVLPETIAKYVGGSSGTTFVTATSSGSLGREALGRILELSETSDAVCIGASLSNNSNTAMLTEKFIGELTKPMIVVADGLTALKHNIRAITQRKNTLIIINMAQVFKIAGLLGLGINIRPQGGLINKLEIIRDLAAQGVADYAVYGGEIITSSATDLIVTPINSRLSDTPALIYGTLSTFWLQNIKDATIGLATGAYVIAGAGADLNDTDKPSATQLAAYLAGSIKKAENL